MEWRTHKEGDTRERLKFAWFPIECDDGITRWLCKVRVTEKWGWWGYDDNCPHEGWSTSEVVKP